jgi:glycosyltransferase involved in cell wall biosynthesis
LLAKYLLNVEKLGHEFNQKKNPISKEIKIVFISWAEYCSRSDNIARELGGFSHMVYCGSLDSNIFTVWLKYIVQFFKTQYVLLTNRPKVVFVMTPPVFAVLSIYFHSFLRRISYIIDAHTAAFLLPRWKYLQWLQRFLCRRAITTIVTNEYLASHVESGGGHATIIRDVPVMYDITEHFSISDKFSIAVVCSFNYDEPIEEIFEAARQLSDIQFYMTGNPKDLAPYLASIVPENLALTGFLSNSAYMSLLTKADAVMTLTTRDHTMLRGAYEAVYQGTPVIISNWQLLRHAFQQGAIHTDNSRAEIVSAVRDMQIHHDLYKADVLKLREKKYEEWEKQKNMLFTRILNKSLKSDE